MAPTAAAQSQTPPSTNVTDVDQNTSTPINSPSCQLSDQVLSTSYATQQGPMSPDSILRLLRNQVCNDAQCDPPEGIDSSAVVVAKDDVSQYKKCEITVGLANGLEGYVFRQTEPIGELQNECSTSIDTMIDKMGGLTKACWWVGTHKNQVYQAGFRAMNASDGLSLHMQQHIPVTGFLADASPPAHVALPHSGSTPKQVIPIVVGVAVGVVAIAVSLVVYLIWSRNKRERERWRAALERRARRKARRPAPGHGHTASGQSATLLGSLTGGSKSWNVLGSNNNNQTAAMPAQSSDESTVQEKEKVPVNDETIAAGLHDETLARRLQRKYDAAQERRIQATSGWDREDGVQSPQPPGYDAANAGSAMDMVQGPFANRISHFAPALGPDRYRFSNVTREDVPPVPTGDEPPLPPPPPTRFDQKEAQSSWRDRENFSVPHQDSRQLQSPTGLRSAYEDRRLDNYAFPPQRPLPDRPLPGRPVHSESNWRNTCDTFDDYEIGPASLNETLTEPSEVVGPRGRRRVRE